MREIKFRAWDKVNTAFMPSEGFAIHDGDVMGLRYGNEMDDVLTDQVELMQYTGLKDLNGVEIYEGDILLDSNGVITGSVRFEDGSYMVEEYYLWEYNFESKVIGNKFQNPELLEVSE